MADCTQQYTDCGEIDELYECAKLLITNSKLFRDWTNGDENTTVILGGKPFPSLRAIIQNVNRLANIATLENPGAAMPDGVTTTIDALGKISAIGGNLQCNRRVILKESGTWKVPVTGWYSVTKFNGGTSAGYDEATGNLISGDSGGMHNALLYLTEDMEVPYVIGAGGASPTSTNGTKNYGGITTFGEFTFDVGWNFIGMGIALTTKSDSPAAAIGGAGPSGGPQWGPETNVSQQQANAYLNAREWYGGGGAVSRVAAGFVINGKIPYAVGAGAQGCIIICWHDPEYASGPDEVTESAVARMSVRRVAVVPSAAEPVTVNLYDPETGQGSVWREEDAAGKQAEGLISEEAWLEICTARAAEERAAWLTNPETEAARFKMLRMACEDKLAATDKLVQPDYPISEESRAEVVAYRQAIRELNHQPGAPWDGGGELTPWPTMPTIEKAE